MLVEQSLVLLSRKFVFLVLRPILNEDWLLHPDSNFDFQLFVQLCKSFSVKFLSLICWMPLSGLEIGVLFFERSAFMVKFSVSMRIFLGVLYSFLSEMHYILMFL